MLFRSRRERAQRAGHDEITQRGIDGALGAFAGQQAECHREQEIGAERGINDSFGGKTFREVLRIRCRCEVRQVKEVG